MIVQDPIEQVGNTIKATFKYIVDSLPSSPCRTSHNQSDMHLMIGDNKSCMVSANIIMPHINASQ